MAPEDKRFFAETLIGMGEVYDRKITPAIASVYFDDLQDYPLQDVLDAFTAHRKDPDRGRFFPKVADLIDKLTASAEETGLVAWSEMLPLLKDSRHAMSPDPITERVVQDLGGWTRLGMTHPDQLTWIQKEFVRRYQMYSERGLDLPLLLGKRQGMQRIGHQT